MIRIWIPNFYDSDNENVVWGDPQIIDDGENFEIIGGCFGIGTVQFIKSLKENNIRFPYLHISQICYEHCSSVREIINDDWFTPKGLYCPNPEFLMPKEIKNQNGYKRLYIEYLNIVTVIDEARAKGIPIYYLEDNQVIQHGDIKMICYRNNIDVLEPDDTNGDKFISDATVCYWFPEIKYWTSEDGCENIYDMCVSRNVRPVFLKMPNHGKTLTQEQAKGLKSLGVLYCWDNNYGKENLKHLSNGMKNCIQSGIIYINCSEDIDVSYANNKGIITLGKNNWIYDVPYKGDFQEGWVKNFTGWWYRYEDGSWAIGWKQMKHHDKDTWFYFDESGYTVKGWQFLEWSQGQNWFYFNPIDGAMKTGWFQDDGLWYYFDENTGAMQTGWVDYEGKKCYFEPLADKNQGQAYRNRIVMIEDEIWKFDKDCYGKEIYINV